MNIDWEHLLMILDYHHRKWYLNVSGHWRQIAWREARDLIAKLTDEDIEKVMKRFAYRDSEAHARPKEQKGGIQPLLL